MRSTQADQVPPARDPHKVDIRHMHETPHVVVSQIALQPGEAVRPHKAPVDAFFYVPEGTPTVEIEGT